MKTVNKKPIAKVIGKDGNVLSVLAVCSKALKNAGQIDKSKELTEKVFASKSYNEALSIMSEYCDLR